MQRVAVLAHVKASSVPPSLHNSGARRIAWHGGKISSNKAEALQKFYQRKLQAGDHLTAQQIEAMQATLGVKLDLKQAPKNPKKVHTTHRSHATKVKAAAKPIVLKTGRVLGPKLDLKQKGGAKCNTKQQAVRQPKSTGKLPMKQPETSPCISLEEKLGLPLHALVQNNKAKRNNTIR